MSEPLTLEWLRASAAYDAAVRPYRAAYDAAVQPAWAAYEAAVRVAMRDVAAKLREG